MPRLSLIPHPSTPSAHVRAVRVSVDAIDEARLAICYEVEGAIDELELPAQTRSQRADGLWRTTCFEAFLRAPGAAAYVELNFSPSSEWAVYHFDAYRQGMTPVEMDPQPRIVCRRREDTLTADIDVFLPLAKGVAFAALLTGEKSPRRFSQLPFGDAHRGEIAMALSAVVKDRHGATSYWALAHPPGKPDFHHADGFALRIAAAGDEQ
jgi:hypothetical protein